jgi:hypothetical protein
LFLQIWATAILLAWRRDEFGQPFAALRSVTAGLLLGTLWGVGGFVVALAFNVWDRIGSRALPGQTPPDERRALVFYAAFAGLLVPLGVYHPAIVAALAMIPAGCALAYAVKAGRAVVWSVVLILLAGLSVLSGHTTEMAAYWRWVGRIDYHDLLKIGVAVATAMPPLTGVVLLIASPSRRRALTLVSLGVVVGGVMAFAQLTR